ncbi:MAG: hypothetical protein ACI4TB_05025 [Lachnospiraceae bacterium]
MEIKKIYFDMDGVLADFEAGIKELCGLEPVNQAKKTPKQDDEMFAAMRQVPHFYDKLKPMPGAIEMFNLIYEKQKDKCEILSGIPKPKRGIENAGEDKRSWVRRVLSPEIVVNIVYREEKKNYCLGPEYVLIDDFQKNIKEWEALGGTGIWHQDVESSLEKLQELGVI